jgi:hypothetical protein
MSGLPDATADVSRQVRVLIVEDEPLVAADLQTTWSRQASRSRASRPDSQKLLA